MMARAKKKESALTPEERLAQALVPVEEHPYSIPKNWCWTRFGELAVDMADGPFGSNLKTEHYTQEKEVRIIQLSNIGENGWREENTKYTTFEHAKSISRSIVEPGDIIIAKMMPAGRAIICPDEEQQYILSSDAVKMVPYPQLDTKFMLYQINSHYFQTQVQENTQGITRARTSIKKLKEYAFAVAPLSEQHRIVARVESLFAKLDEAKEKAQAVLDSFETRKAAILHKAFSGELTTEWRKDNKHSSEDLFLMIQNSMGAVKRKRIKKVHNEYAGLLMEKIPEEWMLTDLDSISKIITDGEHSTPRRVENFCGYYLLSARNVRNDLLLLDDVDYIDEEEYNIISNRCNPQRDDVLISCSGSVGRCCVVNDDNKYCMVRSAAMVSLIMCNPRFIMYMIQSDIVQDQIMKLSKQTAQANLFLGAIASLIVPLPSLEEQNEIVHILDNTFIKEQRAKDAAASVIDQIDTMKKSILAKAFRGELGTNDPSEESAVELLKKVL